MKQRFLSIFLLVTLTLFPSFITFSQQVTAEYEKVNNPFSGYPEPVDIAIFKIEGGEDLEAIISDAMMKDEIILKRFNIYSYSLLNENKEALGLKKILAEDAKTLKALREKFKIKFIVTGSAISNTEFSINLINSQNGKVEYTGEFKNSSNSTAIKDVIKYFTENVKTVYTFNGSLVLNVIPQDANILVDSSPYQNGTVIILKKGIHNIRIKKEGYTQLDDTVLISSGQKSEKSYNLKEITGKLSLTVVPSDASVSLFKGSVLIESWTGRKNGYELKPGNYKIEADKNGYMKQTKEVTIEGNSSTNVDINLALLKVKGFLKNELVTEGSLLHNTRIEDDNGRCFIKYDLDGDADKDYSINFYLLDKNNPNYNYQLKMLNGDAGEGKFAGSNRTAVWNYENEFKGGIDNDGLYLKITAEKIGGGIAWYVWVGGVVVAGGVAAVLILNKKHPGPSPVIPAPPIRP
jgi:hypothetical protein